MRGWPIRWARPVVADHPVPERGKPLRRSQLRMQNGRRQSACGPPATIRTEMKICRPQCCGTDSLSAARFCIRESMDGLKSEVRRQSQRTGSRDQPCFSTSLTSRTGQLSPSGMTRTFTPPPTNACEATSSSAAATVRSVLGFHASVRSRSPGNTCHCEPSSSSTMAFGIGPDLHLRPQSAGGRAARTGAAAGPPRHRGTLDT